MERQPERRAGPLAVIQSARGRRRLLVG